MSLNREKYQDSQTISYPAIPQKRAGREDDPQTPLSQSGTRNVRWKGENGSRYFRKSSAPEVWDEEDEEEEDEWVEEEEENEGAEGAGKKEVHPKVLALHAPNGEWIGAAYYDPAVKSLHVLEDTKDTVEWDLAVLLMEQWDPAMIIMSSQAQDSMIDKVEEWCNQHNRICELQESKIFSQAHATYRLAEIQLEGRNSIVSTDEEHAVLDQDDHSVDTDTDRFAKYRDRSDEYAGMGKVRLNMLKLGCWVNVYAPKAIVAAGALLTYLAIRQSKEVFTEVQVQVDKIESMQLDKHMLINQDALESLAVFNYSSGTASHNTKEKEALSIFTLLKNTITPLGRKLLYTWHLRPLADVKMISARHDAVELFSNGLNQDSVQAMIKAMKRIKNIPIHTRRLRRGRGGIKEWRAVVDALLAAGEIRERIFTTPGAKDVLIAHAAAGMISVKMREVLDKILRTIDFDESKDVDRVCVRPGVNEELDQLRDEFQDLQNILAAVAVRVKGTLDPRWPVVLEVQYFPSLGFLVHIIPEEDFRPPREWNLLFSAEETMYWKTPETVHLDEEYGDIDTNIQAQELIIIQALNEDIKEVDKEIRKIMEVIAELDCLISLAQAAISYHLVRPIMVDEPVLEIRRGRHLLQENFVSTYIANDTLISGGPDGTHHNMMIVTGANGSGKSAYGKQVALIAFMAQVGSFVPAESAVIGIVDKIYTRMQTPESVSKAASAFMIDLSQVSLALRGVTPRSLVVLDEFGKGTAPADGAGLLAGVIEHLINGPCPRTIVLTHFQYAADRIYPDLSELFTQQFVDDSLPILHCHMKTVLAEGTKSVEYLYQLTPGKSLSSNAAECALAHGLPRHIVERGKEVSDLLSRFELARLHDKPLTPQDVKELREAERLAKRFLEWDIDENTQDVMLILQEMIESTCDLDSDSEIDTVQGDEASFEVLAEDPHVKMPTAAIEVIDQEEDGQAEVQELAPMFVKQERMPSVLSSPQDVENSSLKADMTPKRPGYTATGRWKGKEKRVG